MVVSRFHVFLVRLDPAQGREIRKTRPCIVLSPDEMNRRLGTVIVAPMTTKGSDASFRVPVLFRGTAGRIVLDQIRTVDKTRLVRSLGPVDSTIARSVLAAIQEMFAL